MDAPIAEGNQTEPPLREVALVTGFPAFLARRMITNILAQDPQARVFALVRDKFVDAARIFLAGLPEGRGERTQVVTGDVCAMDLGLSGTEHRLLASEVTTIYHLAGIYYQGVDAAMARAVNVDGTRGILEFAGDTTQLRRLCHVSTAHVSGKRRGIILEDELDEGQEFFNIYEQTRFEAEKLVRRARRRMPVSIFRPGIVVGDSQTGEIDRFDGPYYLMRLIAGNATQMALPLPGRGTAPLNLVPVDYVIDALYALSMDERAAGMTFHLTDPSPLSARRIYELVAERCGTTPPRGYIPGRLTRTLMRIPGIRRAARNPLSFLDGFDHQVFYNCRHTQTLLAGTGIACPPFESYVDNLIRYMRETRAAKPGDQDDELDPLD